MRKLGSIRVQAIPSAGRTVGCAALLVLSAAAQGPLTQGDPLRHGLNTQELASIRECLAERLSSGEFAGAALLIAHRGEIVMRESIGNFDLERAQRNDALLLPILASATLVAVERGLLSLDAQLGDHLIEFRGTPLASTTIRTLLQRQAIEQLRADREPGTERRGPSSRGPRRTMPRTHEPGRITPRETGREAREPRGLDERVGDPAVLTCRMLEMATGMAWADWLRESFLDPAGMHGVHLVAEAGPAERLREVGLELGIDDLGAFAQLYLTHGACGARRVLSEASIATQQGAVTGVGGRRREPALGWRRERSGRDGVARTLTAFGDADSAAWVDYDRELIAVVLTRPGREPATRFLPELQERIRAAFGATEAPTVDDFGEAGPWTTSVDERQFAIDGAQSRLSVSIHAPRSRGITPVVIHLVDAADPTLPAHLASHGFLVLQCLRSEPMPRERARSAVAQVPGAPPVMLSGDVQRRVADRHGDLRAESLGARFASRAHDVTALLDALSDSEQALRALPVRVDLQHVAVIGEDEGAVAALALAGATLQDDERRLVVGDARVRAIVTVDVAPPDQCGLAPAAIAQLAIPTLFVARDTLHRVGRPGLLLRAGFDESLPIDRFLLTIDGGRSWTGDGSPVRIAGSGDDGDITQAQDERRAHLLASITAFLDAQLRDSTISRQWLAAGGFTVGSIASVERR